MTASIDSASDLERTRKRLIYRAEHRGTKELDILFGTFARQHLASFDAAQLERFEHLMSEEETQLSAWLLGQESYEATPHKDLLKAIQQAQALRAKNLK